MRSLIAIGLVAGLLLPAAASASQDVESAWTEYGARNTATARAITSAEGCPRLEVNGKRKVMDVRAAADPPDYPNLVCQGKVGSAARSIEVGGISLPVPDRTSERVVVVGDSGCRMEDPSDFQACRDPAQWPFAEVAGSIAEWGPDVVVHVGDYHYRESPCPAGNSGCQGSPAGYNWASWDDDFFTPAAPALEAAPWVFTRGNHEACGRAGIGWFRYLYQRAEPAECEDYTPPFPVPLGDLRVLELDSSQASDDPAEDPEAYVPQFAQIDKLARPGSWFVTHRPLWGVAPDKGGKEFDGLNETLQAASGNELSPDIDLSVSGHVHLAEVLDFAGDRQSQIIVGTGGTELDDEITAQLVGADVAGETVERATVNSLFGYMTFKRSAKGWLMRIRAVDGSVLNRCVVQGIDATCKGS